MTRPLRFGILGTGNIARQFAEGVAGSSRCAISAVASRRHPDAQAFAARHAIAHACDGYQALLDLAADTIDAVYIALPNALHHAWTLRCLAAGKHVLCEKPIASNAAQAAEMFDAAARAGRVLMEAFMYRCHPQTHAVMRQVRAGAIGRVRLIRTAFCFRVRRTEGNIRFDAALAGGALMDIGCYCVDFSRMVAAAEPTAMHVVGRLHPSGVDEYAAGVLQFPGGVLAEFCCGMTVQSDNTARICGDEGYLEIPWPWKPPAPAPGSSIPASSAAGSSTAATGGPERATCSEGQSRRAAFTINRQIPPRQDAGIESARPREEFTVETAVPLYALEADAFAAVVRDGAAMPVTAADSLANMRVLDELRRQLGVRC